MASQSSVRVCVRFRPQNQLEVDMNSSLAVELTDNVVFLKAPDNDKSYRFDFDHVFGMDSTQEDVFEAAGKPLIGDVLQGYNGTVFVYGQTGAGKSWTMTGSHDNRGVIPRSVDFLFDEIGSSSENMEFTIKVAFIEIYLEKVKDLLNPNQDNLKIREGSRGMWIEGVTELYASSSKEVMQVINKGNTNRVISRTRMNMESSRSHSVFMITVSQKNAVNQSKKQSKLLLVDLAGSEKVRKTEAQGHQLKEAQNINKSLSALGMVINALTTNSAHVPYRDSKLTKLLSDSLGGNSKTCLVVCCSPSSYNLEETLSTCRFGQRAKMVKNIAKINQEKSLTEYKELLEAALRKNQQQEEIICRLENDLVEARGEITGHRAFVQRETSSTDESTAGENTIIAQDAGRKMTGARAASITKASSAIIELQVKVDALEGALKILREDNEAVRDALAERESELESRLADHERLNEQIVKASSAREQDLSELQSLRDRVSKLSYLNEKYQLENEEKKFTITKLQNDMRSIKTNATRAVVSSGLWSIKAPPEALIDANASSEDKVKQLQSQYESLFGELSDKVAAHVDLQERYSDIEQEMKTYRAALEQQVLDESVNAALKRRTAAEKQSETLVIENDRMRRIGRYQTKLLNNWREQMERMEAAVEKAELEQQKSDQQYAEIIQSLKENVEKYRKLCLASLSGPHIYPGASSNINVNFEASHSIVKPIHGRRPTATVPNLVESSDLE